MEIKLYCQFIFAFFSLVSKVEPREAFPDHFEPGDFYPRNNQPDARKSETLTSGAIRDVIKRDSPRYRKVLIRNSNDDVVFGNEDSRFMTSRTKSKLDVLASLFKGRSYVRVRVLKAWTDEVDRSDMLSLHYEGRALLIQAENERREELDDLAKLANEAGFDWIYYKSYDYIHVSVLPDVCQTKLDLTFVVDTSGSVGSYNFKLIQQFLKKFVDYFDVGAKDTQIALISYSYNVEVEFYLNQFRTKKDVKQGIDHMWYQGSWTATGNALKVMVDSVFKQFNGMRNDSSIPKLGILLTDGRSTPGTYPVPKAARQIKEAGINMFVIGVTSAPRMSEIAVIASQPLHEHYIRIEDFNDLSHFVDRISMVSCDQGAQMSKCATTETGLEGGSFKYFRIKLLPRVQRITIELTDTEGTCFMYVSLTVTNPGPLSEKDVYKIQSSLSPKTLPLDLPYTSKENIVYIAVQGQQDDNKFALSIWDSLFTKDLERVELKENAPSQLLKKVQTKVDADRFYYFIKDGDPRKEFTLDKRTGELRTRVGLDRERTPSYSLSITAIDMNEECHKGLFILNVKVLDVDDNVPLFTQKEYRASVRENTPSGKYVIQVKATDPDTGTNAELRYFIDEPKNVFSIDEKSGIVTTHASLDYETKKEYVLKLSVKDMGPLETRGHVTLTISIIDVNEPPSFTSPPCVKDSSCKLEIPEEQAIGTVVEPAIHASDPDKDGCQLKFHVVSQDQAYFTIDKTSGVIKTKSRLDREKKENYILDIQVDDCGDPKLSERRTVRVKLSDINDNSPVFSYPSYTVHVREDESVQRVLPLRIHATDADLGSNADIHYKLDQKETLPFFKMDPRNAQLTLVHSLDRETQDSVTMTVTAIDGGNPARSSIVTVTIIVTDVNDNTPQFVGDRLFSVEENVPPGRIVGIVKATDADAGLNGKVRFKMARTSPMFTIDRSGKIRTAGSPDRETIDTYSISVQAYDLGKPSLSNVSDYVIKILDVNDNAPSCKQSYKTTTIKQNTVIGTEILKLEGSDLDLKENGTFTFRLASGSDDKFEIKPSNGKGTAELHLKGRLLFAKKSFYELVIDLPDNGTPHLTGHCRVGIKVEDTNDHSPVFTHDKHTGSVKENVPIQTRVTTVHATDGDLGTSGLVEYSIVSQKPAAHYSIDSKTGDVITSHTIDYEQFIEYTLIIKASDHGIPLRSTTTELQISVIDQNDNFPAMKTFKTSIAEDALLGTRVGVVSATDRDTGLNGQVSFETGSPGFPFNVSDKGIVTVSSQLDRETIDSFNLRVIASDKGTPSLSISGFNSISITDVNDNSPSFTHAQYSCTVMENSLRNTFVCVVTATDSDTGENARVSYFIQSSAFFKMDESSGRISVLRPIDRETTPEVEFKITAKDHGKPSLNGTAHVHIKVLDVNDNKPQCTRLKYSFNLTEEQPDGTLVGQISATDTDEGSNAQVLFRLIDGHIFDTKPKFFLTDEKTNSAILKAESLDYEERTHYTLTVGVKDHGNPQLSSQCSVDVQLIDINDNAPVLKYEVVTQSIKESVAIGTYVTKIIATDKDSGLNSKLSYRITSGNERGEFTLNMTTGILSTAKKLDYDTIHQYNFTIEVKDHGTPRRSVMGLVYISIIAVDRTPPKFKDVHNVSVSEDLAVELPIMQFEATGEGDRNVTFRIVGGNEEEKFQIDVKTGLMVLQRPLDRETTAFYNITVEANDRRKKMNASLPVIVLDVNDNTPLFNKSQYTGKIPENQIGDILRVKATDKDIGINAEIEYRIVSGDLYAEFTINQTTGTTSVVSTRKKLDREKTPFYSLIIEAADKGHPVLKSNALVTIEVQDVNDNHPDFELGVYTVAIAENTGISFPVLSVSATDIDLGENGTVRYRIMGHGDEFAINTTSGEITTTKIKIDRELRDYYEIIVEAYDLGIPVSLAKRVQVKVNITDVNDNAPEISSPIKLKPCNESSLIGTKLDIIRATDKDIGINAELFFSISGSGREHFRIDPLSGQIYLKKELDAETQLAHNITISVTDKGIPSLSVSKMYQLDVLDADDNKPVFTQKQFKGSIKENVEGRHKLFSASATDSDVTTINSNLTYKLITNDPGFFQIQPQSGDVYVTQPLDYETTAVYEFVVTASDWKFTTKVTAYVDVINVNDNSPLFQRELYTHTIEENTKLGTFVLTVKATDLDPFGDLRYSLVSTEKESLPFQISSSTGRISVTGELDRETTPWFFFKVMAFDRGIPVLNGTAHVNITLSDVNDNQPEFNSSSSTATVQENQDGGTYVTRVIATDRDIELNGRVKFYPSKPDDKNFHIDTDTGRITTKRSFDREMVSSYKFSIVARDCGTPSLQSEEFVLKVTIGDENDNAPSWDEKRYVASISEGCRLELEFIEVSAIDPDIAENGTVSYGVMHPERLPFKVLSSKGLVYVSEQLDRESIDQFNITLVAHDNGTTPLSSTCQLLVNITDINDNHPIIDKTTIVGSVYENQPSGTKVMQVNATDLDIGINAELVYEISGPGSDLFKIDSKTGQITTLMPLDREEQEHYFVNLKVSDRGVPLLSSNDTIHIQVLDLDDNCPVFYPTFYKTAMEENSPYDTYVVQVSASDADIGSNAVLNYGVLYSDGRGVFNVDPDTGIIRVAGIVDREFKKVYYLEIRAGSQFCGQTRNESEGEKPLEPRYVFAKVYITVLDQNDNAPTFVNGKDPIYFKDILTKMLYQLNATDPDLGPGGEVEFRMKSVVQGSTRDHDQFNKITVEAFDHGTTSLVRNHTLTVKNLIPCDKMNFHLTPSGVLSVDTLCAVSTARRDWKMLVGGLMHGMCNATGNTLTRFRWIKDGDVASVWSRDGDYDLEKVTQADEGSYACVASSSAGTIQTSTARLIVEEKPNLLQQPSSLMVDLGGDAVLQLVATGDPTPTFEWYKKGRKIQLSTNPTALQSSLVINNTIIEDTSIYTCKISNQISTIWTKPINLTIVRHADVVSLNIEVNRPDEERKCHLFSVQEFQTAVSAILKNNIIVTDVSETTSLHQVGFCNKTACSINPCQNGGKCEVVDSDATDEGYKCNCKPTWHGKHCEQDINECSSHVGICNGINSTCHNLNGSFSCKCSHDTTGHRCKYMKNACVRNNCDLENEYCVPSELDENNNNLYACVKKDHVMRLGYDSLAPSWWSQQHQYELVDRLNEIIKTQRDEHDVQFAVYSADLSACTFHMLNVKTSNKSSSAINLALYCPNENNQTTSGNLSDTSIASLCSLLAVSDKNISECGRNGTTHKIIPDSLEPARAKIHLILKEKRFILNADEALVVLKQISLDGVVSGMRVREYNHAYQQEKRTGGEDGEVNTKTIVVVALVVAMLACAIGGVVWLRRRSTNGKLFNKVRDYDAFPQPRGKHLVNPAYDGGSLGTMDSEENLNFTYDVANEKINWDNVKV